MISKDSFDYNYGFSCCFITALQSTYQKVLLIAILSYVNLVNRFESLANSFMNKTVIIQEHFVNFKL